MFKERMVMLLYFVLTFFWGATAWAGQGTLSIPEGALISSGLNPQFVAQCSLFLAVLLLWTTFVGKFLKLTLRLPAIAGQIIGGVLLGPSFMDIKGAKIFSAPVFAFDWATQSLYALASSDLFVIFVLLLSAVFTVPYLLWIAGHETNIKDILNVGVTAVTAGVLGAALPVIVTVSGIYYMFCGFSLVQSLALGLVLSATSVSIPIAMFFSQNKMHLKTSKATLGAAIIDDIVAVIALSVFSIFLMGGTFGKVEGITAGHHTDGLLYAFIKMFIAFAVIGLSGYFVIPPAIRQLKKSRLSHLIAPAANGMMFLYFSFAELVGGLSGITGAYFAGLFHRMGDERHQAEKVISPYVNAVLLPLFLGSIGLQVNIGVLGLTEWIVVLFLLFIAIISKLAGCYVATWTSNVFGRRGKNGWSWLEGFLFGSSMVARGEVGLVIATILRGYGPQVMPEKIYVIAVVVIILTTIVSPIMLSIGFSIQDLKLKAHIKPNEYILNIGLFNVVGSTQMFNIILGRVESLSAFQNTNILFSEGRRIVNIEGHNVKIILSPNEGIIFEGDKQKIEQIIKAVRGAVVAELERIPVN